jgi:hypothetical protein
MVEEMATRPLRKEEIAVVHRLLEMVPDSIRPHTQHELIAIDMEDGGMGSIRFVEESDELRRMGCELMTAEYIDEDQIPVLISVNLDKEGRLFELDFWKVNFDPVKRYPRPEELHAAPPATTIDASTQSLTTNH